MAGSIQSFLDEQGVVTKYILFFTLGITLLSTVGALDPMSLIMDWDMVFYHFHIWRPITALCYWGPLGGPKAFTILICMYLTVMYSSRLENGEFNSTQSGGVTAKSNQTISADFLYMNLVSAVLMWVCSYFFDMSLLADARMLVLIWIWCRRNPSQSLSIMGFFEVQAIMFPWVLAGIHFIFGNDLLQDAVGIAVGHFFIFCVDILPYTHGWNILKTPSFIRSLVKEPQGKGIVGRQNAAAAAPSAPSRPSFSGAGRRLGDS